MAKTTDEWVSILNEAGLPCGPILAVDEVFEDPQVRHLEMAQPVVHPVDGELDLVRLPLTFSETPASIRSAAPLLGADTERVLVEHGFAEAEIATLAGSGAISLGSAAFDK